MDQVFIVALVLDIDINPETLLASEELDRVPDRYKQWSLYLFPEISQYCKVRFSICSLLVCRFPCVRFLYSASLTCAGMNESAN